MKRVLTIAVLSASILAMGLSTQVAQAGNREWATTGKILTGVIAAGVIANAYAGPPPCREVAYYRAPVVRYYEAPVERCYVRTSPRYRQYNEVEPVRYVQQEVVTAPVVSPTETVWVLNSNGSHTPVQVTRANGGMYMGPKGEYYNGLPTNEQLRQIYGM